MKWALAQTVGIKGEGEGEATYLQHDSAKCN